MKENNLYTHGIHSYHAKFIPAVPAEFINRYSKDGDVILDPFCGSGTTVLESVLLGKESFGVDMNNIAYMISRAKIFNADVSILDFYYKKIISLYSNLNIFPKKDFENKYIWFSKETADTLDKLLYLIDICVDNDDYKNIFEVIVSSILKTVSNKRKVWNNGYIADNVLPNEAYNGDAFSVFCRKYAKTKKAYSDYSFYLKEKNIRPNCHLFLSNILDFKPNTMFDMVITSPPYPFAVDFVKYNRLTYYWFGWDVEKKSEEETGSRTKRNRKNAINDFFEEMTTLYKYIFSLVKDGGYFCMTVADTQRNKLKINFVDWLKELFNNEGWHLVSDELRKIEAQSMAQKRISHEHKLVFKKISLGKNK